MKITFACPHCAKPLVADVALAGRTGRCRHCGQRTVVPGGQGESGNPRQTGSGKGAADGERPVARPPAADWRAAVASQLPVPAAGPGPASAGRRSAGASRADAKPEADASGGYKLRPVTPVRVPALAASDWDNAELGPAVVSPPSVFTSPTTASRKPSRAAPPTTAGVPASPTTPVSAISLASLSNVIASVKNVFTPSSMRPVQNGASPTLVAYRTFFGLLGRVTTWISETSYTLSFILIILAVASGMVGRHSLAAMVCAAIVALNLIGLAGDIASLVTLSFRKNPLQGTLFLVPPITLYYLWTDWQRYRDTVARMRIPLVTLAIVVAAYVFIPWLRGGIKAEVPAVESVEKAVDAVEGGLAGEKSILDEGLKKARSWLHEVPLPNPSSLPSLPGSHGTPHPANGRKP